jgi:hypothetical protein
MCDENGNEKQKGKKLQGKKKIIKIKIRFFFAQHISEEYMLCRRSKMGNGLH